MGEADSSENYFDLVSPYLILEKIQQKSFNHIKDTITFTRIPRIKKVAKKLADRCLSSNDKKYCVQTTKLTKENKFRELKEHYKKLREHYRKQSFKYFDRANNRVNRVVALMACEEPSSTQSIYYLLNQSKEYALRGQTSAAISANYNNCKLGAEWEERKQEQGGARTGINFEVLC